MIRINRSLFFLFLFLMSIGTLFFILRIFTSNQKKTDVKNTPTINITPPPLTDIRPFLYKENITQNASEGARELYRQKIRKASKATSTLRINGCKPQPLISLVKEGSLLTILNEDNTSHTIFINQDHTFDIGQKDSIAVTADFGRGAGIYEYHCDMSLFPVGILLVSPQ